MILKKLLERIEKVDAEIYKENNIFYININNKVQNIDEFWSVVNKPSSIESAVRDAFIEFVKRNSQTKYNKSFSLEHIKQIFQIKFPKPDVSFKCEVNNGKFKFTSLEDYDKEEYDVMVIKNNLTDTKNIYHD